MMDFQQRRKIKNIVYSKLSFVILFIFIIFLVRANYDIYKKYQISSGDYQITKKEYDGLKSRRDMLDSEINRLKTDTGIEEEIRGKFNVAKPGETVVTIINNSNSTSSDINNNPKGLLSNFLEMFK